ncbi:MAG: hypothetical protein MJ106_08130, partial [Lentisphaeria bacterium]|nr:hypothetical protein [Lentisphaeria bacterium]
MKTFHECGLLLLSLFAAVLLCCEILFSCGKKAPFDDKSDAMDNDELSEQIVRCRSSVDGTPLECTLHFPEDYDFAHPRPLIVVLPEMELPGKWRAGQALVARLASSRPNGCPYWLLHEDVRNAIDYLCDNFPVTRNQIYLAANGIDECRFACMNAQRFAGIYLQLEETAFDKWEELPLKNLLNVPLFLQNDNFSPVATELQQRLQRAGARYLNAPEFLLASTPANGIVQAFAWLSAQKPSRERIAWEGSRAMPRDSWWIRADSIREGGQMGTITAKYDRDSRRIYIYTKGMDALSVDTGWEGFDGSQAIDVEIDGCIFAIPCSRGWVRIAKDSDGMWDAASLKPNAAVRTDYRMHGLRAVMTRRVLLVYGSVNDERAEAWKASAIEFADAW